jgi:hypothetical protein
VVYVCYLRTIFVGLLEGSLLIGLEVEEGDRELGVGLLLADELAVLAQLLGEDHQELGREGRVADAQQVVELLCPERPHHSILFALCVLVVRA